MSVNPIKNSYLRIDQIKINDQREVVRRCFRIPDGITSVITDGKMQPRLKTQVKSRSLKITKIQMFGALLLKNELLGCVQTPLDREGLLRSMRREFPKWSSVQSRNFFNKFSDKRNLYNQGKLHRYQTMPPLYAWVWGPAGYIVHHRYQKQFLSFDYCKRHLVQCKIADPRFFDPSERDTIARKMLNGNATDWHLPPEAEVIAIENEIGKSLFNSLKFPPGYEKGKNPI